VGQGRSTAIALRENSFGSGFARRANFQPVQGGPNMKILLAALAISTALTGAALAQDAARIALLHGLSGSPLEAYSKQTHTGFEMDSNMPPRAR
jgi:hypothetical protein